jgi:hypothetical protein
VAENKTDTPEFNKLSDLCGDGEAHLSLASSHLVELYWALSNLNKPESKKKISAMDKAMLFLSLYKDILPEFEKLAGYKLELKIIPTEKLS